MAAGDDRSILQVAGDEKGVPKLYSLNEVLRQLQESIAALEGRIGAIVLRDDLTVMGSITVPARALSNGSPNVPALSPSGQAIIYFDKAAGKLKASENGGPYTNIV